MATKVKLIETGAVTGNIIPDGGIATGKLANDAVTTIKISDANITHAKLHTSMDLTGKTVTVATAAGSTNTTAAASTAFVQQELTTLIGGAPSTLNDLNELAAAINDDSNYNSTLTTALATKLPLAGGTMTGPVVLNELTVNPTNNLVIFNEASTNTDLQTVVRVGTAGGGLYLTSDNAGVSKGAYYDGGWIATSTSGNSTDYGAGTSGDINVKMFSGATIGSFVPSWDTSIVMKSTGIDVPGNVTIGTSSVSSSYGKLTVAGTGISITPDTSAKMQIGRYNAANPYSYIKAGSTSSGFKFTNAADNLDLLIIDSSGMSVGLVTTNDIKATGAGGISIQTDEGTKRIEVFDNGKITFNNLIYQSGINNNTINSGYNADADDHDIWINYRGYNDGHTRFRDFRIGDGKSNPIAFFDGSEMTANIHTLKVHTGSFRAVGTLGSTNGMGLTGVGLGQLSNYAHAQFSGSAGGYIDFAEPNVDWSGRIIYTHSNDQMAFYAGANLIGSMDEGEWIVRGGGNANQGKITFSTQSTAYNILGGNYWGYTGINSGGHIRLGSNNGEQMRLGAGASTGNMALGLIGVSGANSEAAIHGQSNDSTLLLTNTDLSSNSTWGFTGRGGRILTSNGSTWTNDGKDAALVIGSNKATTQRGGGLGIVLHNESNVNGNYSPGIYFSTQSESAGYNTAYGYIMGAKTGRGVDTNWSTGEIHMDTAGTRTGTTSRSQYMDGTPAFRIDDAGDISMPYTSHAYGQWAGSSVNNPTNNTGWAMSVQRSQNMTYQNNASHGHGMTVTKAGMYVLGATGLYDPVSYVYIGWCINGAQQHHWHSNHAVSNNHDYVSVVMRYLNIGDHVTFESSNIALTTYWGGSHSSWYMYKVG